jgi:RND superfamily putative drug exporter
MNAATLRLAHELLAQSDVFVVAIGTRAPYVDSTGRYRQTVIVERDDFGGPASQALVHLAQSRLLTGARFPAGTRAYLGGAPAQGTEFLERVYGSFGWVVAVAGALSFVVLARALRSLLLPLIAIALDAVSVSAAYGLVVVLFRFGVGAHLLGLYRTPQMEGWVPVFLFAMLFGLSMDYEVFFVTRMREAWDAHGDNKRAIEEGLARTGRVVTAAALIMVGALSGMVAGRVAGLQELGAGLALGVLVDATLVRGLLMPSIMTLAGRWNWWLPEPVAHLLRVAPSPLAPSAPAPSATGASPPKEPSPETGTEPPRADAPPLGWEG